MSPHHWSRCSAVERVSAQNASVWVVRGTKVPVASVLLKLSDGASLLSVAEDLEVSPAQVQVILCFVATTLEIHHFARFGQFRFDLQSRTLFKNDREVHLYPKAAEILSALLEQPGAFVSTKALLEVVWKDWPVTPSNVHTQVSAIRKLEAKPGDLIERRGHSGYRLVPHVTFETVSYDSNLDPMPEAADLFPSRSVVTPARESDFPEITHLGFIAYSPEDALEEATMRGCYRKNPNGYTVVLDDSNRVVANLNILPVRPEALERLIAGTLTDKNIQPEDIYGADEAHLIDVLYVESLVSLKYAYSGTPKVNPINAHKLIAALGSIVPRICNPSQLKWVYAIAASDRGRELLQDLGCVEVMPAASRADYHAMFRGEVAQIVRLLKRKLSSFEAPTSEPALFRP